MVRSFLRKFVVFFIVGFIYFVFIHKLPPQDEPECFTQSPLLTFFPPDPNPLTQPTTKFLTHSKLNVPNEIAVDTKTNTIYTGLGDGSIIKILNQDASTLEVIGKAEGQVTGLILSRSKDSLLFLSTKNGLCKMDLKDYKITILASERLGKSFSLTAPNSLAEGPSGKIYFTESSDCFPFSQFAKDFIRAQPTGSLFVYDPNTKETTLLCSGLYFANGLAVEKEQKSVLVAESTRNRVKRIWISGEKKGESEILIDDLPGVPDGLDLNQKGQLWIAILAWRDRISDFMFEYPYIRRMLIRGGLEHHVAKMLNGQFFGGVKVNVQERIISQYLLGVSDKVKLSTAIRQVEGKLYIGSLVSPTITILRTKEQYVSSNKVQNDQNNNEGQNEEL